MAMLVYQRVIYLDGDLYGVTRIMGRLHHDGQGIVPKRPEISAILRLVNHQKMTPIFSLVIFHDSGLFY